MGVRSETRLDEKVAESWPDLKGLGRSVRYPNGSTVVRQGDEPDSVHLIEDGAMKLVRSEDGERDVIVTLRFGGWILGIASAVLRKPYATSAVALGPCMLRSVSLANFNRLRESRRTFAGAVERMLAMEVFAQVSGASRFGLDAGERLKHILLDLSVGCGRSQSDGAVRLDVQLTQTDLADLAVTSREEVNRLLARLETAGVVRRPGGHLIIWTALLGASRRRQM